MALIGKGDNKMKKDVVIGKVSILVIGWIGGIGMGMMLMDWLR